MFIIFAIIFSLVSLVAAIKLHDRWDPARYFLLFWGGQVLLIYIAFQNKYIFTGYGLAYLSATCIIFSLGTLIGRYFGSKGEKENFKYELNEKRIMLFLKGGFVLAIANVVWGIYVNGFNLRELVSFRILMELNNAAAENRYTDAVQSSALSQLTLIFVYLTPLLGGYLLPMIKGKKKIWCYLALLPALLISITQAVKTGLITSVALWSAGVLVSAFANNREFIKIKLRTIVKLGAVVVLFFAILFVSMVFRTGKFDKEVVEVISDKFIIYAFGHVPAFDMWFSNNIGELEPTGGVKTFYGITNFLGIAERKAGVFTEHLFFGKGNARNILPDTDSNVYTLFRFLLEDFGLIGSLVMLLITGAISGYAITMVRRQQNIRLAQTILISVLFFIAWSFVASVWAYTSFIATIVLFFGVLMVSYRKYNAVCQAV
jgi:oligosaccharide repeat unit polymerase